jgi:rhodanese-related sulfurtransferase
MKNLTLCLSLFLSLASPMHANIYQGTLQEAAQATPEISTDELRAILETGSSVVFDARPHAEFAMSHIPGAVNVAPRPGMPASLYTSDVAEIGRLLEGDKSRSIVLYCNGPFCGKSKRLGADLVAAGYTRVCRYQLGMPVWRALVGVAEIETSAVKLVHRRDRTAWFVDARPSAEFAQGSVRGAVNIPRGQVTAAKDDGRLPMEDHNTRVIVFGANTAEARTVAADIAKNAFSNVTFWSGAANDLIEALANDRSGLEEPGDPRP